LPVTLEEDVPVAVGVDVTEDAAVCVLLADAVADGVPARVRRRGELTRMKSNIRMVKAAHRH
jgi:hypothetical protein